MNANEQQADLFSARPAQAGGTWLEKLLFEEKRWLTAAEILQRLDKAPTDDMKRWLRDEASKSPFVLSGPGAPGYRHIARSTPEEIRHYMNSLISQGKLMIRRGLKIQRAAHEIFGN